jgi:hypothetical protein
MALPLEEALLASAWRSPLSRGFAAQGLESQASVYTG